jgi:hypothetical protein
MNPFDVLGIHRNATSQDISAAYRALAKRYHPDLNPGQPMERLNRRMAQLNWAYDELSRRREYWRSACWTAEPIPARPPSPPTARPAPPPPPRRWWRPAPAADRRRSRYTVQWFLTTNVFLAVARFGLLALGQLISDAQVAGPIAQGPATAAFVRTTATPLDRAFTGQSTTRRAQAVPADPTAAQEEGTASSTLGADVGVAVTQELPHAIRLGDTIRLSAETAPGANCVLTDSFYQIEGSAKADGRGKVSLLWAADRVGYGMVVLRCNKDGRSASATREYRVTPR